MNPQTLVQALQALRDETERGFTFLNARLEPEAWSFASIVVETERRARALLRAGLQPGDRLALILPEGRDFVLSFLAAVQAGVVPVPMYPPVSLARAAAYLETTRGILTSCGARHLLTLDQAVGFAEGLRGSDCPLETVLSVALFATAESDDRPLPEPAPDDVCFLQYTSGSTGAPKGVVVTHANVAANGLAIMRGLGSDRRRDRGLSWLPLYHDMGLVGFVLAPLMVGVPVVFVPTLAFVKQPSVWLELVDAYRATISFGPNFAFALCTKRAKHERRLDLSCLRVLGCGAEPINPESMRAFLAKYQPHGLDPKALIACYGMAEATLAIAFENLQEPFRSTRIDRDHYAATGEVRSAAAGAPELELASCGRPFPGHVLRIADEEGRELPHGSVGEVLLRGPSTTRGYWQNPDGSRELLRDGWLHTGDLGFLLDGCLYISGRKKDLIILNGRNHYPQTLEWEVERIEGVRAGSVVAFACDAGDTERAVVVAEAAPGAEPARIRRQIQHRLSEALGIACDRVLIVKQGSVPRTTSGKVQRRKTRTLFETGALRAVTHGAQP